MFPTYVSTGDYFIDYKDYDMDLSNFDENYISLEINGRYDGKQLGLPTGISGSGMLVNKDLADAIGIDFSQPYTWSDLRKSVNMTTACICCAQTKNIL